MSELINIVAGAIAGGGLASAAVIWLSQTWISERLKNAIKGEYDQKLETFKAQLQAETAKQTEQLKANLQINAIEHQVRFSRLHERAAETIAETFAKLQILMESVSEYTKAFTTDRDAPLNKRREACNEALRNFRDYYRPRRIYLPSDVATQVSDFSSKLFKIADDFAFYVEGNNVPGEKTTKWIETTKRMSEEIKPVLEALEREFRLHLGVVEKPG